MFYYKCPDHRKNYVMSFAFQFDKEDDVYEVECKICTFSSKNNQYSKNKFIMYANQ